MAGVGGGPADERGGGRGGGGAMSVSAAGPRDVRACTARFLAPCVLTSAYFKFSGRRT